MLIIKTSYSFQIFTSVVKGTIIESWTRSSNAEQHSFLVCWFVKWVSKAGGLFIKCAKPQSTTLFFNFCSLVFSFYLGRLWLVTSALYTSLTFNACDTYCAFWEPLKLEIVGRSHSCLMHPCLDFYVYSVQQHSVLWWWIKLLTSSHPDFHHFH